ncbi:nucleoside phosphatase family-domain-containing protein [Myxozyma melibiosi]|uniref:Nucleoside phosphatase family-domain-containing protein n=1 Tax=Myxozyma melibiosi TaxID=54550 RepID=A0ABR1FEF3_9ASCO
MPALPSAPQNYGVVIDAGSSGSRVQIYSWSTKFDSSSATLPKVGKGGDDWYLKVSPGISSYADHQKDLEGKHLDPLLERALAIVPKEKQPETPIFLLATAGMRLLPDEQQKQLLAKTCFHIKKTTNFLLPDCDSHIRVIDGETEGLYGWLALNYMLGAIDSPEKTNHGKGHHTFGFLDMGGASAQIAFAPNNTEAKKHMDDLYGVRLRTQAGEPLQFNVFVSTWLGYGANEAHRRYIELLVKNASAKSAVPTLLERDDADSDDEGDDEHKVGTKTAKDTIIDPCSPRGYTDSSDPLLAGKTLYGSGNLTECLQFTYPLLSKDLPCHDDPCLFGGVHAPAIDFDVNHFVGVSEYWHTTRSGLFADALPENADSALKIDATVNAGGAYNYAKFSKRLEEFCASDWDPLATKAKAQGIDLHKLQEMCFKGSWVMNMLHSGFGVPRSSEGIAEAAADAAAKAKEKGFSDDSFQSIDKINGVELSWTLGKAVLYAASQVPLNPKLADAATGNMSAMYDVGYGPNSGIFIPERVDVGTIIPDPVIVNDVDEWGVSAAAISSQGTFGKRRMPGLVMFALIFMLMAYVLAGKVRRRKFTFTLTPKRYRRRVTGVGNSTAMESSSHLVMGSGLGTREV